MSFKCAHVFRRRKGWWHMKKHLRWECYWCHYRTRSYDGADRMGMRPLHPHMPVAAPGYNTAKGKA